MFFFLGKTPIRFWRAFLPDDFVEDRVEIVSNGNFGLVKRCQFKNKFELEKRKQITTYADLEVAIKDPKGWI